MRRSSFLAVFAACAVLAPRIAEAAPPAGATAPPASRASRGPTNEMTARAQPPATPRPASFAKITALGKATSKSPTGVAPLAVRNEARALRAQTPGLDGILREQSGDAHLGQVLEHSQTNGNYYIVSDLHIGVGRTRGGAFDAQEDFRRGDVFVKTVQHLAREKGNNTLVVGGDFLDIIEHVAPEEDVGHVKEMITRMVHGHATEFRALAKAVVDEGLRLVYLRGNHDIRMLDTSELATTGTVREHFMKEMASVAGLDAAGEETFRQRVGFAGHMAPLGKFGEILVVHGDQFSGMNSWRSSANPYTYRADGTRVIPRNFGDAVVQGVWRAAEQLDPSADNNGSSSTEVAATEILKRPKLLPKAVKVFRNDARQRIDTTPEQQLAERLDDRAVLTEWAKRSGFADMMNRPLQEGEAPRAFTPVQLARTLDRIYQDDPTPIHDRMTSPYRVVNAATILIAGWTGQLPDAASRKSPFFKDIMDALPNVRFVVAGHDHAERAMVGERPDRGAVGFIDSGTWTRREKQDQLNVIVAHTDTTGRVTATPELFRTNPADGLPELAPHEKVETLPE